MYSLRPEANASFAWREKNAFAARPKLASEETTADNNEQNEEHKYFSRRRTRRFNNGNRLYNRRRTMMMVMHGHRHRIRVRHDIRKWLRHWRNIGRHRTDGRFLRHCRRYDRLGKHRFRMFQSEHLPSTL